MESSETRMPQLLALSFIATPLVFFGLVTLIDPIGHFAAYLFLAWSIAAVASAITFGLDRAFAEQFSTSEKLAILAGNAIVALFVASIGYMATLITPPLA